MTVDIGTLAGIEQRLHQQFTRAGVRNVAIPTDGDYVRSLMQLFGERQASGR